MYPEEEFLAEGGGVQAGVSPEVGCGGRLLGLHTHRSKDQKLGSVVEHCEAHVEVTGEGSRLKPRGRYLGGGRFLIRSPNSEPGVSYFQLPFTVTLVMTGLVTVDPIEQDVFYDPIHARERIMKGWVPRA